jgi:branched-chain amino acid transport system permease protein
MIAGAALAVALAVVIGYPCFRLGLRGDYFTLATVAFGQVAYEVANGSVGLTRGSQGIPISFKADPLMFQFQDREVYYYIALVMWLGTVVLSYRLRRSRVGFEMLAVRDDEAAAARGGISVLRSKLTSFAISAAIAAVAGTFYAQFYLFIDPGSVMSLTLSIQIVLVAALGGMNSPLGGTVGAIILVPVSQVLSTVLAGTPGADLALYGVALVLIMLFMPFGILGLLRRSPRWRKVIGW